MHNDFDDEYVFQHFEFVREDVPEILESQSDVEDKPLEVQLRELRELVFSADDTKRKTAQFFSRVISKVETEYGEPLSIAPGADKAIISEGPSPSLKQQLFEEAAEHIRQFRQKD